MKIDPKGRIPVAGIMKFGSAYQAANGIGLREKRREGSKGVCKILREIGFIGEYGGVSIVGL